MANLPTDSLFVLLSNHLGKSLQLLMDRVDEMSQDIVKYNTYLRNTSKQQQQKHQVGGEGGLALLRWGWGWKKRPIMQLPKWGVNCRVLYIASAQQKSLLRE